jgi:hypothetical protein
LTPLRTQWIEDADLVEVERLVRLNLDFDMIREPVDPVDVDGLIAADTRPWSTVEEFESHRDALENWKKSRWRVLKTVAEGDAPASPYRRKRHLVQTINSTSRATP